MREYLRVEAATPCPNLCIDTHVFDTPDRNTNDPSRGKLAIAFTLSTAFVLQEVQDLATVVELFAGDAICFATVTCLAAHLPYPLRAVAMERARDAASNCGLPVSQSTFTENSETTRNDQEAPLKSDPDSAWSWDGRKSRSGEGISKGSDIRTLLHVKRHGMGDFVAGVLTNMAQLQSWAYPPISPMEEDGDDSADDSDDRAEGEPLNRRMGVRLVTQIYIPKQNES